MIRCPLIVCRLSTVFLIAAVIGCGDNEVRRYRLSGTVSFDNKPVPSGNISFDQVSQKIGGGYVAISNGKYDTESFGRGHLGGKHIVLITGFDRLSDPKNPESQALPMFQPYETEVELPKKTSTMDFKIPPSQTIRGSKSKGSRN